LGNGPLPLDVLQSEVENWIAEQNGVNAQLIRK
jgi:hypothetical protein